MRVGCPVRAPPPPAGGEVRTRDGDATEGTKVSMRAEDGFSPIESFAGRTGHWRRVGFLPRVFELMFEEQRVARLEVGIGRRTSQLTSSSGAWDIVRPTIMASGLDVQRSGQDAAMAEFEPSAW